MTQALARAREALDNLGGVLYDDSRAYIVTAAEDTETGVRVSGDQLTHDRVWALLVALTEAGSDFTTPLDRDGLLAAAAAHGV